MENKEISDKIYYLKEKRITEKINSDFFYCNISADKSNSYTDIEQFNEYVLYLMSEFSKSRLVESFICEVDGEEREFVPGKMISGIYTWEVEKTGITRKKVVYKQVATLSKDNEFMKYSNRVSEYEWFDILVFPYKEINFDINDPQTVIEYANSNDYILSILPEIVNPECWIEVNTKYMSKEEFIQKLTKLTEDTGRTLEVCI